MSCACDFEAPTLHRADKRMAKKRHQCCECAGVIEPGEVYEVAAILFEGDFDTYKTCPDCLAARQLVWANVPCMCLTYTGLWEEIEHALDAIYPEGMGTGLYMRTGRLKKAADGRRWRANSQGLFGFQRWPRLAPDAPTTTQS